jgi:hypothetical protein
MWWRRQLGQWLGRSRKSKAVGQTALTALLFFVNKVKVFANETASDLTSSKLVTGTEKLIRDATTWMMVLAPVTGGLLIMYFCIRRSAADEMDQSAATRCC